MLADTLAAHDIGGFKVGVGFSLRKCRMCLATKEQLSTKVKYVTDHCHNTSTPSIMYSSWQEILHQGQQNLMTTIAHC